jgi:hypothetical protein
MDSGALRTPGGATARVGSPGVAGDSRRSLVLATALTTVAVLLGAAVLAATQPGPVALATATPTTTAPGAGAQDGGGPTVGAAPGELADAVIRSTTVPAPITAAPATAAPTTAPSVPPTGGPYPTPASTPVTTTPVTTTPVTAVPAAAAGSATSRPVPGEAAYLACVRQRESRGQYGVINSSSGAGGAYQFLPDTWAATARHAGRPDLATRSAFTASPADQDLMARHLLRWQGRSHWAGWGC